MRTSDKGRVIQAALRAREKAKAAFSQFRVGAALLTRGGKIIGGANVESASYGLTCCAERVALFKALTDGETEFVAVGVVGEMPGGPPPCGACRQLLAEYAPGIVVWTADSRQPGAIKEHRIAELLPRAFVRTHKTRPVR